MRVTFYFKFSDKPEQNPKQLYGSGAGFGEYTTIPESCLQVAWSNFGNYLNTNYKNKIISEINPTINV